MTEHIEQVAARIKELRKISGFSKEKLAEDLGIASELYKEYESGEIDIPVSLLFKIAGMFKIELTALLTGEDPRLHVYSVVRKGKGVSVERRKEYRYQSLAYNFVHKKAEPLLVTVDPAPPEAPLSFNAHPGQEFHYVLEGKLQVVINGHEIVLNEGDSLFFDSSYDHGTKALDGKPARLLAIIL